MSSPASNLSTAVFECPYANEGEAAFDERVRMTRDEEWEEGQPKLAFWKKEPYPVVFISNERLLCELFTVGSACGDTDFH